MTGDETAGSNIRYNHVYSSGSGTGERDWLDGWPPLSYFSN